MGKQPHSAREPIAIHSSHGIYDGHTLRAAIEDTQRLTGREIERIYVDKGYRGHDAPNPRRVFISGQKRDVVGAASRTRSSAG